MTRQENRIILSQEESAAFLERMARPDPEAERRRDRAAATVDLRPTADGFAVTAREEEIL